MGMAVRRNLCGGAFPFWILYDTTFIVRQIYESANPMTKATDGAIGEMLVTAPGLLATQKRPERRELYL